MKLAALRGVRAHAKDAPPTIAAQMRSFLAGYDTGATLLHALYDDVLDEPVPARLRAMVRR